MTKLNKMPELKPGGLLFQGKYSGKRDAFVQDLLWLIAGACGLKPISCCAAEDKGHKTALASLGPGHLAIEYWPEGIVFIFMAVSGDISVGEVDKVMSERGFIKQKAETSEWLK